MAKDIFFFIGTEAEFIKVFPVIIEAQNRGKICHIIASGQNDITKSRILEFIKLNGRFIELSHESDIKKSAVGLFTWFGKTLKSATSLILKEFKRDELEGAPFIVHGDTVSTYMGAIVGAKLKAKVCHVEAGLRSHHLFNPFPEEIDRLLTSRKARYHFAPGEMPVMNLKKAKGEIINTGYNTILDALRASATMPVNTDKVLELDGSDYFVFVMHRQENLADNGFFTEVIERVKKYADDRKCVLILHKITENKLMELGLLDKLLKDDRFILLPRVDYFDFMKLLKGAAYVITDGGSNQEELSYMGKPCIIMRKTTERNEGLGENALLFGGDLNNLDKFVSDYKSYERPEVDKSHTPGQIIADKLVELSR